MSDDIRVILIKISDRVHNMRTLESMLPSKQYKIAGETQYIFAPLADRLGLNKIKTELENLSFKYEHPEAYQDIVQKLEDSQMERDDNFNTFIPSIREALDKMGCKYSIKARIKSPYSIWKKMQTKKVSFEEVFDIMAIRIVFEPQNREEEVNECFRIYAALTSIYRPHPTRFRDWLSSPKANGYQALHNTFMSNNGKWIEVQIRSDRMDDIAEQGFAAHWKYKAPGSEYDASELDGWLNSIKEILDDPQPDTLDLLDTIKLNLYAQEILVFTPKGEIKTMPAGSTVLDFAFSIHSFLGSHCFGAKVNHKLEPLSYQLKSGDQIEILTSKTQHVQPEWLNFATSAKARGKIQAILRRERREKEVQGEAMLKEFLERYDVAYNTNVVEKLCKQNAVKTRDELFLAIADKKKVLTEADIDQLTGKNSNNGWRKLLTFLNKSKEDVQTVTDGSIAALETREFVKGLNKKKVLALDEEVLLHCTFPTCCTVVPGDDVLGYINENGGLEIHRRQCETATKYKTRHGNNIIACSWNTGRVRYFDTRIFVRGVDAKGVLHSIADCFETLQQYLVKEITLKTNDGIFEGSLLVSVYHVDDISMICDALRKIENVTKAVRMD
jgi:GTP pyrophosphokinase